MFLGRCFSCLVFPLWISEDIESSDIKYHRVSEKRKEGCYPLVNQEISHLLYSFLVLNTV